MFIGHWTFTGHWTLGIGHYLSPSWLVGLLEFRHCRLQVRGQRIIERLLLFNPAHQRAFAADQVICHFTLAIFDFVHRHVIEMAVLHRPEHCHLHLDRRWLVLRLLENFDHPFAALDLGLGL